MEKESRRAFRKKGLIARGDGEPVVDFAGHTQRAWIMLWREHEEITISKNIGWKNVGPPQFNSHPRLE